MLPTLCGLWVETTRGALDLDSIAGMGDGKTDTDALWTLGVRVERPKLLPVVEIERHEVLAVDGDEKRIAVGTEPCGDDGGVGVGRKRDFLTLVGLHIIAKEPVAQREVKAVSLVVGVFGHNLRLCWQAFDDGLHSVGDGGLCHGFRMGD